MPKKPKKPKKLIRPFTGAGAVFFPIGKPPAGTCEFATPTCIEHCYAGAPKWPNYDIETIIPESEKQDIYGTITGTDILPLCERINFELDGLQTPILHWFGSGDCQTKDTDRISTIIQYLQNNYPHIKQMGFTRNVALWEKHKDVFALTIERPSLMKGRAGMFSVPQYKRETSVMCTASYHVRGGYCGPDACVDKEDENLAHYINCRGCLRLKTGCFDRRGA